MLADASGKSVIGVRAYDDNELRDAKGRNIEERAADFITKIYEKYLGHGLDSTELRPFPSKVSGSLKWTASWIDKRQGQEWENSASKVFARLSPSWVAQITVMAFDDAVARNIIQTLNTIATADCYWPFIRKHIPALRTQ